jgi:hypothetical protein
MKISDQTSISMPMRNLISIVAAVGLGVWAYFGVIERLNQLETGSQLVVKDLTSTEERLWNDVDKNNEFRIKWPRGELGSPPADAEQFMLIEHIAGQLEKIQDRMEEMMNNGVNIKRLQEDVKDLRADVEKLKDGQRSLQHTNGE